MELQAYAVEAVGLRTRAAELQQQLTAAVEEGFAAQQAVDAAKERAGDLEVRLAAAAEARRAAEAATTEAAAAAAAAQARAAASKQAAEAAAALADKRAGGEAAGGGNVAELVNGRGVEGGMLAKRRGDTAADEVALLAGKLARSQQQLRNANLQIQQLQADIAR